MPGIGPSTLVEPHPGCDPTVMTSIDSVTRPFLVVGFDGSPSAFAAVDRGAHLARVLDADLRVVTTWMWPATYPGANYGDWFPGDDAEALAAKATDHLFDDPAPAWYSTVVLQGMPARILIEQSAGAEMLIVGSRGHGGFAGLLLGSVSGACAEHAWCPVLIMHSDRELTPAPSSGQTALLGAIS